MFTKQLKYDFMFSVKVFLSMAAILIAVGAIVRFTDVLGIAAHDLFGVGLIGVIVLAVSMVGVTIISIMQLFSFYKQTLFSDTGYLTLTLPIKRHVLILSKLIVAMVWFNVMVAAGLAMTHIITSGRTMDLEWLMLIDLNFVILTMISCLYFMITLANSVIGKARVHGFIAAVIGIGYMWLFFWIQTNVEMRFTELQHISVGIQYGRIPVGDTFIDIFYLGICLIATALTFLASNYLLKKHVSLT